MNAVLEVALSVRHRAVGDDLFIEQLGQAAFADFDPNGGPHTLGLVESERAETFLAVRGTERLGFLVLQHGRRGAAWIEAIAVEREARGSGVGSRLMAAAELSARRAGHRRLRLATAQANVEALALFLKRGFHIEERVSRFYRGRHDACLLGRAL